MKRMNEHFEYNTIFNDTNMNIEVHQYYTNIIPVLYTSIISVINIK